MFNVAGYLIEERRIWPIITASPRGQCSKLSNRRAIGGTYVNRGQLHTTSRSGVEFGSWRLREERRHIRALGRDGGVE